MSSRSSIGTGGRVFASAGALLFAASLVYAAIVHSTTFGRRPTAWSWSDAWPAIAFDTALFSVFALHHSVFARTGAKAWMARHAPAGWERPIYVWGASLLFIAVMSSWREVPGVAWSVSGPAAVVLVALMLSGVVLTGLASRHIGVLKLAGLAPSDPPAREGASTPALKSDGLYGLVRHPIYFAWLLLVWPVPLMTGSRLLFAVLSTAYLVAAVPFEERSLVREFGPAYDAYRARVRWRMLWGIY